MIIWWFLRSRLWWHFLKIERDDMGNFAGGPDRGAAFIASGINNS